MHLLPLFLSYLVDIPTFDQSIIINNKRFHELVGLSVTALQIVALLHFLKNKASLLNYMYVPPLTLKPLTVTLPSHPPHAHLDQLVTVHPLTLSLHKSLKGNLGPLIPLVSVHGIVSANEGGQTAIANGGEVALQPRHIRYCMLYVCTGDVTWGNLYSESVLHIRLYSYGSYMYIHCRQ